MLFLGFFSLLYVALVNAALSNISRFKRPLQRLEYVENVDIQELRGMATSPEDDLFRLRFTAFGTQFFVHFEPNHHLFHGDAEVNIYGADGKLVKAKKLQHHRVYRGRVLPEHVSNDIMAGGLRSDYASDKSSDLGWARFSFHPKPLYNNLKITDLDVSGDFDGALTVGDDVYHIKPASIYDKQKHSYDIHVGQTEKSKIVIYRDSDRFGDVPGHHEHEDHGSMCGHERLQFNVQSAEDHFEARRTAHEKDDIGALFKRSGGNGCPTATKIIYMGVAADCTYVSNYGGSDGALKQIVSDWNQASALYESTFNIALGIITVNLQASCGSLKWNQQCSESYNIATRLSDFSQWRSSQNADAGLWHLMSMCSSGTTVGISWLGMACETATYPSGSANGGTDYVTGSGVSTAGPNEWVVVAHEIGHSFGAIHDCSDDSCTDAAAGTCCPCTPSCNCQGAYIMNPTSDVKTTSFSPCTVSTICSKFPVLGKCLQDPGTKTTISGNQCGNGVKEPGEQCDCGPADQADCRNSACCNGKTCTLKPGAACDDQNDLCCSNCKVKPQGNVCRPSRGVCDVQEQCDGSSGICPKDIFLPDLSQCQIESSGSFSLKSNAGQCASGDCTSRDYQCQLKGTQVGITQECPGYSAQCAMYCRAGSSSCIQVSGFFVDGTACGYKGTCKAGVCQSDGLGSIFGWFMEHTAISIAIGIIVLCFLAVCLAQCIRGCFSQSKSLAARSAPVLAAGTPQRRPPMTSSRSTSAPPYPYLAQSSRPISPTPSAPPPTLPFWVDPTTYNGQDINPEEIDLSSLGGTSRNSSSSRRQSPLPPLPPRVTDESPRRRRFPNASTVPRQP